MFALELEVVSLKICVTLISVFVFNALDDNVTLWKGEHLTVW